MKGNDGTGNVAERDEWETPQKLWDKLNEQYKFQFDCCATEENKKCNNYFYDFEKVDIIIDDVSWMNPPFSKAEEMFTHFFSVIKSGVAIYRCDNLETALWQDIILSNASWIFIPDKRVSYEGFSGKGARFGSALIGFNVPEPKGLDGTLLIIGGR